MVKIFKIMLGVILMLVLTSCGDNDTVDDSPDACVHVKAGLNSCNCTCGDICVIWRDAGMYDSSFGPYDTDLAECVEVSSH